MVRWGVGSAKVLAFRMQMKSARKMILSGWERFMVGDQFSRWWKWMTSLWELMTMWPLAGREFFNAVVCSVLCEMRKPNAMQEGARENHAAKIMEPQKFFPRP